jgi:hypothetical protein
MSGNFSSPNPSQPLSVGNVVSAGFKLYRSHLKEYFFLALKAYVWLIIPIYGWAKFFALIALISRLSFGELVNQPETVKSGERFVDSRVWQFFVTLLLMFLINIGMGIAVLLLFGIIIFVFAFIIGLVSQGSESPTNPILAVVFVLLTIVLGLVMLIPVLWFSSRFYLVDVPLAIEDRVDGTSTIGRSWELTQGHAWRVLLIGFVAYLITFPLQLIVQIISYSFQIASTYLISQGSSDAGQLLSLLNIVISFVASAAIVPFYQTVKAVIYYDLRSRREGMGLELRDYEV